MNGKIASAQIERNACHPPNTQQAGITAKMSGRNRSIAVSRDLRSRAICPSSFDPQKANDDKILPIYGQTTAGPTPLRRGKACACRIDG
jgi:hypothetical protein